MENGDLEEGVAAVLHSGQGVVPGKERGKETKHAASLLEAEGSSRVAQIVGILLASQKQESDVQGEEEEEEHEGGSQSAQEEESGEDEPAGEEEAERTGHMALVGSGGRGDAPAGSQENAVGDPETTVGGQSGSAKGVSAGHFPHAGQQLDKPAVTESKRNDHVGLLDPASVRVDGGEDEGGQGEGAEAKRSRVGKFPVLIRLPQARERGAALGSSETRRRH